MKQRKPPTLPDGLSWRLREASWDSDRFLWQVMLGAETIAEEDYSSDRPFDWWHALGIWPSLRRQAIRVMSNRAKAAAYREQGRKYR